MSNNNKQIENLNTGEKIKKGGSQKRSWVWDWFECNEDKTLAICQVEIGAGQHCAKSYKNGSSTGNLINHLTNKHLIIEEMNKEDFVVRKM
jgi:hypothetical protein